MLEQDGRKHKDLLLDANNKLKQQSNINEQQVNRNELLNNQIGEIKDQLLAEQGKDSIIQNIQDELKTQKEVNIQANDIEIILREYISNIEDRLNKIGIDLQTERDKKKSLLNELSERSAEKSK